MLQLAIALSSASPLFDYFGHYVCDASLSIPTRSGFYASKVSLECSHTHKDTEIILGLDRVSACSVIFYDDGHELRDDLIDIDVVLSNLIRVLSILCYSWCVLVSRGCYIA
jgi:hypothetical protein